MDTENKSAAGCAAGGAAGADPAVGGVMGDGLKACPFCGSSQIDLCSGGQDITVWWAACQTCHARGPGCYYEARAQTAWSRRQTDARAEAAEKRADAAEAVMRGLLAVYDGEVRRQKAAVAEAAEARAAQAEAAGYRRAVDDACAALSKRAGYLRNFDLAGEIVRALAPVEPVSKADELPGGAA